MPVTKIKQVVYRYFTESWTLWGGGSYIQVHICMYVCMYVCVYVCVYICIYLLPLSLVDSEQSLPQLTVASTSQCLFLHHKSHMVWPLETETGDCAWQPWHGQPAPCDTQHSVNRWQYPAVRYNKYPNNLSCSLCGRGQDRHHSRDFWSSRNNCGKVQPQKVELELFALTWSQCYFSYWNTETSTCADEGQHTKLKKLAVRGQGHTGSP